MSHELLVIGHWEPALMRGSPGCSNWRLFSYK